MTAPGASDQGVSTLPRPKPPRRSLASRLSLGHVIMILAGLLAVLVNFALLRSRDETFLVAVAAADIRAGSSVDAASFLIREVQVPADLLERLVVADELPALGDKIAARTIPAGDMVSDSDFIGSTTPLELRAMSIPIAREHAAGGELSRNDRVDVIHVVEGVAQYVVTGAVVLDVAESVGGLGAPTSYFVTVAVDDATALALAAAINDGDIEIIRSTGAAEPTVRTSAVDAGATGDATGDGEQAEGGGG